jgi:hypothetical protein
MNQLDFDKLLSMRSMHLSRCTIKCVKNKFLSLIPLYIQLSVKKINIFLNFNVNKK